MQLDMFYYRNIFRLYWTLGVLRAYSRSYQPFWIPSSDLQNWFDINDDQRNLDENLSSFSNVPADGLAPLCAKPFLGTIMLMSGSRINTGPAREVLTHWGRVTHTCVSKLTIIGSDNGLSPDRRQATIWTNAGILLIGPLGTNFSKS